MIRQFFILATLVLAQAACSPTNHAPSEIAGVDTKAIIGGTAVSNNDPIARSTVQVITLQVKTKGGKKSVAGVALCSGTLLTNDIILTAGHCSAANPKYIFLNFSGEVPQDFSAFFQDIQNNSNVRRVVAGQTAPNWAHLTKSQEKDWGDLSLLKFDGGLVSGFTPATMISSASSLQNNMPVTLAGFGETDGVNHVPATQLMKTTVAISDTSFSNTEIMIANVDGRGACHGDSGGPAYVTVNGRQVLAGVTSRADSASDPKAVCVGNSIYTSVASYTGWIQQTIQTLESPNYQPQPIAEPRGF